MKFPTSKLEMNGIKCLENQNEPRKAIELVLNEAESSALGDSRTMFSMLVKSFKHFMKSMVINSLTFLLTMMNNSVIVQL